jgi:hypothetical protein
VALAVQRIVPAEGKEATYREFKIGPEFSVALRLPQEADLADLKESAIP